MQWTRLNANHSQLTNSNFLIYSSSSSKQAALSTRWNVFASTEVKTGIFQVGWESGIWQVGIPGMNIKESPQKYYWICFIKESSLRGEIYGSTLWQTLLLNRETRHGALKLVLLVVYLINRYISLMSGTLSSGFSCWLLTNGQTLPVRYFRKVAAWMKDSLQVSKFV